jgi:hypothetical protein
MIYLLFALGYMLIDHFLDNKDICLKEKEEKNSRNWGLFIKWNCI